MSDERDDQERPCLHCMIVELIDDFFDEFPAATGETETIDPDEVVTAIAKTVAEFTHGQDGAIRQQLIEQLVRRLWIMTQSFAEKPELVRWALMHGTRQRQVIATQVVLPGAKEFSYGRLLR